MKKLNIIIFASCVILMLINLYIHNDVTEFKQKANYGSANSGIGVGITYLVTWGLNSIFCVLLLITTIVGGFKKKELTNIFTLLNIGLIILTFYFPFWL